MSLILTSNFSWNVTDFTLELFLELNLSLFPLPLWPSSCLKTIAMAIYYLASQNSLSSPVWCQVSLQKNKFNFLSYAFKTHTSSLLTNSSPWYSRPIATCLSHQHTLISPWGTSHCCSLSKKRIFMSPRLHVLWVLRG